jgi:small subunit ribosomal protein S20
VPAPSKRDKQSVKRGAHNKGVRTRLRNLSKNFYRAVESGDEEEARRIRDESQREGRRQRHDPSEQGCP